MVYMELCKVSSSKGDSTQSVYSQDDVMGFPHIGHNWGQSQGEYTVKGEYTAKGEYTSRVGQGVGSNTQRISSHSNSWRMLP